MVRSGVQGLSQEDSLALVFPLLENCLPVLTSDPQQPGSSRTPAAQHDEPSASLAETLPFASLAATNVGFHTLAKVSFFVGCLLFACSLAHTSYAVHPKAGLHARAGARARPESPRTPASRHACKPV